MIIEFLKYQACGNDFIIIDTAYSEKISSGKRGELTKFLCDRHFGIGADDVLYLDASSSADKRLKIFEAQGPEADMCGNGIRCAAAYLHEKLGKDILAIETNDGIKHIEKIDDNYKVTMGPLRTKMRDMKKYFVFSFQKEESLLNRTIDFLELGKVRVSLVNSSEPHCVIFVTNVDKENIKKYGRNITENKHLFPNGINVNLVEIINKNTLKIRTYERGVFYETLACGTGATASAGVAYLLNKVQSHKISVITRGGAIKIMIAEDTLYMIGPAQKVFEGMIEI